MNAAGLPWSQDREGSWIAVALCGALIVFSYAMLRRLKILS
jgi:hypothetical protein